MIEVDEFSLSYFSNGRTIKVLNNLSFSSKPNCRALAIVGANASGKTSFAYTICGIIPDAIPANVQGSIKLLGKECLGSTLETNMRSIGFVFQDCDAQLFSLRVGDEITNQYLAHKFKVDHLLESNPADLSMGEKQRLSIVASLERKPSVLILDEPATTLDPVGQHQFIKLIQVLKHKGIKVILFTHNLNYAKILCDQIIGFKDGGVDVDCFSHGFDTEKVQTFFYLKGKRSPERHVGQSPTAAQEKSKEFHTKNQPLKHELLRAENVIFAYSRMKWKKICNQLSLSVIRGEILGLAGLNGCGKSTLMYLLAGIKKIQAGKISIDNTTIANYSFPQLANKIGILFQNPSHQLFAATLKEELLFGLHNLRVPIKEAYKRIRWAKDFFELGDLDRDPQELSYGQKKLLCLACVVVMKPEIILLDEPELGLDPYFREKFKQLLWSLKFKENKTFIIASHDLDLLKSQCERIALMDNGKILHIGSSNAVFPLVKKYFEDYYDNSIF